MNTNVFTILILLLAIVWGRLAQPATAHIIESRAWSPSNSLWHKAWSGSLPGIGADLAILNVFNIYAQYTANPKSTDTWKTAISNQLHIAQSLDPYFHDTYRLSEGLLAYEAGLFSDAVDILTASEPFLHQFEPLLVAAFIAHQDMHDQKLAALLARQAAIQPDAPPLAFGYAAKLTSRTAGCKFAIAFLKNRINVIPVTYRQSILKKIKKVKGSAACQKELKGSL